MQQQYATYRVLFFLFLLILPILLKAQPSPLGIDIENNWEVAKIKAAEQGKFIFVDFTSKYCGNCKKMEREVFTIPKIRDAFNRSFIFLQISDDNLEVEQNKELINNIQPAILPAMVFYKPNARFIESRIGAIGGNAFFDWMEKIIQNNGDEVTREEKQTPITPPPTNNGAIADNLEQTPPQNNHTPSSSPSTYKGGYAKPNVPSPTKQPIFVPPTPSTPPPIEPTPTPIAPPDNTKVPTNPPRLMREEDVKLDDIRKKVNTGQYVNSELKTYAYLLKSNYQPYQETADWYLVRADDVLSDENSQFILDFANTTNCRAMVLLVDNIGIFKEKYGKKVNERITETLRNSVRNAPVAEKERVLAQALAIIEKAKLPNAKLLTFELKGMCYQGTEKWQEYSKLCKEYITDYKVSDYKLLNDIANVYAQNVTDAKLLQDALIWAEKSVRIEPHYYNNQTCAMLYLQLGKHDIAKEYANHALELVSTEIIEPNEAAAEIANIKQKLSELF